MDKSDKTINFTLESAFRDAFNQVGIANEIPIRLVDATNPEFGDYQINGVMGAAKSLKTNPRELANRVIEKISLDGVVSKLEVAGPGFINITLDANYLAGFVNSLNEENRFGVNYLDHQKEIVVVDLSSPNLAKEMHVGHLRSTVIGDSLSRIFAYMVDKVIPQNHVGDWGTQFGMLIAYLLEHEPVAQNQEIIVQIKDLEQFYQKAKRKFDEDGNFANKARDYVVKLQSHDPEIFSYWYKFREESLKHCEEVYKKLHIDEPNYRLAKASANGSHEDGYVCGESFYNDRLPQVIEELKHKGLLEESEGAKCVFVSRFAKEGEFPGGEETPFIVQKQDGGYLYSTTDLAAVNYRVHDLKAGRIVYVVDARQSFHFKQLFIISKAAGFAKQDSLLEHSSFGTMMNEDGRPFKTRDGGTVKLIDLVNEAINRANNLVKQRNPEWSDKEQMDLAEVLAIGAIKYSDLSKNRNSDYIFSFDKMLAFDGNTAPYLLYAYTRIQSILKKSDEIDIDSCAINISNKAEHKLALHLAKFATIIEVASRECFPHYICQYLYDLSGLFMQFYESCPILKVEDITQKYSRLRLAKLTAEVLKHGLNDLLGIHVVDRM